jgi:hypothetical protein
VSIDDFLSKAGDAEIIYSNGACLLDSFPHLRDCFVTYPYVELGVFNTEDLEEK